MLQIYAKNDGSSNQEKAELLNSFFRSVFTEEQEGDLPDPPHFYYGSELSNIDIPVEKVKKLLRSLRTGKAPGPDGLHPLILSKAADVIAKPITTLFRRSLSEGSIPGDWRLANVTPIFKKGSRLCPNNYRPVSLTCILCKLMEKLVREQLQLVCHLERNNLISEVQHGCVKGRSCVTQLLDVLDLWTGTLDDGGSVDVIFMDFQKAFDSVPHRRLVSKIMAHGITGRVLKWIQDFLRDRQQRVVVGV